MEWLSSNISKINYGQHPKFSVPHRITVLLPLEALRETPFLISVIDTKGVEGTTQRPDLMAQIEDTRTVTVLCCKFSDAPGGVPLRLFAKRSILVPTRWMRNASAFLFSLGITRR